MTNECRGKCVVLGVTSSVAAYKACEITSRLMKLGVEVYAIMTENATRFLGPLTLESVTGHPVAVDMFAEKTRWDVEHISLAKRANVFLVAPATANFIGKLNAGIADDMLTTTVMATKAPVIIAPAMNVNMYENPITQRNIAQLTELGYEFVEPVVGHLAEGIIAKGHIAPEDQIVERVVRALCLKKI